MLSIEHNAPEVRRWLSKAERDQLPFATAVALTRTARDVASAEIESMRGTLEIRNRGLLRSAVRSIKASKRDWPNSAAVIHVPERLDFLADHALGATRRGTQGHRRAIPTKIVKRTAAGKVRAAQRPARILKRKAGYLDERSAAIRAKSGAKRVRNLGKGATWYLLREQVKIRKVWPWERTARDTVAEVYGEHFQREFAAALQSKKQKRKISSAGGRQAYLRARQRQGALPSTMRKGANYNRGF